MALWISHPLADVALRVFIAVLVTLFAWWLAKRLNRILHWVGTRIERLIKSRTRDIKLPGIDQISQEALTTAVDTIAGLLRVMLVATLFYAWLVFTAYILDESHHYVWLILHPLQNSAASAAAALTDFLPNIVILVLIFAVGRVLQSIIRAFTSGIALGKITTFGLDSAVATPTHRILSFVLWVSMIILAAPYLPGSDSKAFQAVSVMLGVLVSLGSSSFISNLIAGLTLTYSRAYRIGDRVRIGPHLGDVVALGAITTRIRTIKDEELIIPNGFAHGNPIVNYSRFSSEPGVQAHVQVTIGYDIPYAIVESLLIRSALATPGIAAEPSPYVLQPDLLDNGIAYEICAYTRIPNELHLIEANLRRRIQDQFFAAGIELCTPAYTAIRDGNASVIPREQQLRVESTSEAQPSLHTSHERKFRVQWEPPARES